MIGLGIESSCDETSLAVVRDGKDLLGLKIFSQTELHSKYRGVVPELASRAHLEKINFLLDEVLDESKTNLKDLQYVSVSSRPGLIGSLMIGASLARTLGLCLKIPIIAVDHLEAHLSVVNLENKVIDYPFIGLLLSGGNSSLFIVKSPGNMEKIGDTMDDALGEAFDKVANLLELPYPGGPEIEKKAMEYTGNSVCPFPQLLRDTSKFEDITFSYSGLKTSVLYFVKKNLDYRSRISEICFHFQNTAFELVERNLLKAIKLTGLKEVVAAGGVMANETLRNRLKIISQKKNFQIYYPEKKILCTDNGAMVASLGYSLFKCGQISSLDFAISPNRENNLPRGL